VNLFDKLLRSRAATTIFLLAAIGAQTPHAAYVFYTTANDSRFTAWLAAFALESAVLHFVLHGQRKVSYLFATVSVAMNLAYYRMHGVNIFALEGATAWLLAIALPVAIAFYSHSIAENAEEIDVEAKPASIDENAVESPFSSQWVVNPISTHEKALRHAYAVERQSIAPYLPEEVEKDASMAQVTKIEPVSHEAEPLAYVLPDQPMRKETGVERARRLAAERAAEDAQLHNLTTDERREMLRKMRSNGHADTAKSELAQMFAVNPSTITRDLQALGLQ
jgi:hypothetical protein